jgi:hypothetical protein
MRLEIGSTATPAACVRHFRDTPGVTSAPERPAYNREVNGLTLATTRPPIHQQPSDRSSPRARTTSNGAMYTMSDITKFSPLFLFAGLVLAAPAAALAKGGDTQKAETPMTRPAGAPDTNAAGKIRVEHDTGDNRDKLKVEAQYIDTSLTFEAWVADGGGTLTFIANMPIQRTWARWKSSSTPTKVFRFRSARARSSRSPAVRWKCAPAARRT